MSWICALLRSYCTSFTTNHPSKWSSNTPDKMAMFKLSTSMAKKFSPWVFPSTLYNWRPQTFVATCIEILLFQSPHPAFCCSIDKKLEAWRIHLTVAATLVDQYWCGSEKDTTLPITAKHSHASLTLLSAATWPLRPYGLAVLEYTWLGG